MARDQVWSQADAGQEIPPLTVEVSKVRMMMYAAATWNPYQLHWDSDYSQRQGFPEANVAGPMMGDYLAEMLVRWAGGPSRLRELEYTNRAMAFPGDLLTFRGRVVEKWEEGGEGLVKCRVWGENREGRNIAEGLAVVRLG